MTLADRHLATIPPLENGDRLTRNEFERRYHAMPQVKKAELVEGIAHMSSPVRARKHGRPHAAIMTWLGSYWLATPGLELLDNPTVRLDADNEPQPDVCLRIEVGGQLKVVWLDYRSRAAVSLGTCPEDLFAEVLNRIDPILF